ncbi:MAG: methylated-DNA--[protein]-cysteine S-methyltransferase [Alphaproteobacteria bacterium]
MVGRAPRGTFAAKVLAAVRRIPAGRVATYGDIAALAGSPRAHRAVGTVMRECRDPGVPCHRVIAAGGALGGYGRFLQLKRDLLRAEGLTVSATRVRNFTAVRWPGAGRTHGPRSTRAVHLLASALLAGLALVGGGPATHAAQKPASGIAALVAARDEARTLLANGQAPSVPAAAFQARDAALALDAAVATLPADVRVRVERAVRAIVLAAWRLDAAGDAGDLAQLEHGVARLSEAVTTIDAALPKAPGPVAGVPTDAVSQAVPGYTDQVRPVLRERCAVCHDDRGAAVRLLDYASAVRAAPAIRDQVLREVMPPWFVDPEGPPVTGSHTMRAREIDTILRWTSRGTPEGASGGSPPAPAQPVTPAWTAGPPSRVLEAPAIPLVPGQPGARTRVAVATGLTGDLWVRAVDVLPSDPSLLRAARVSLDGGPVLGTWFPGESSGEPPAGTAFRIPAGATLQLDLQVHALPAGSTARTLAIRIGLYDAPAPGRGLVARTFDDTLTLDAAATVVGVRVIQTEPLDSVDVVALAPDGRTTAVLRLRASHPGWDRRYWLVRPVALAAGTSLSVHVSGENPTVEVLLDAPARP